MIDLHWETGVRVYLVREDRIDHQRGNGLQHQRDPQGRKEPSGRDPEPKGMGWCDGGRAQLLGAGKPGRLHGSRALHRVTRLQTQPCLWRVRVTPQLVLWLRGGHLYWAPQAVLQDYLRRRPVALPRRSPLYPHRSHRPVSCRKSHSVISFLIFIHCPILISLDHLIFTFCLNFWTNIL